MNSYEQQRRRMSSAKPKPKATIAANAPDLRSYNYSRYHQIEKPLLPQQYSRTPATVAPSVSTIPLSSASGPILFFELLDGCKEEEEEEPKVNEEEGNADAVWENLQEIFQDIDARSEGLEGRQQLKKPIMHLRRLLQMHSKIRAEEIQLEKMYLGVSYEREWYLRKLQAVEAVIAAPETCLSRSSLPAAASWRNDKAVQSLVKAISIILYEDNEDFSLVGSKLPLSYNM